MAQVREKSQGEPEETEGPFSRWFGWGHLGVTIALAMFLYTVWNDGRKHDAEDAASFTRLESRVTVVETEYKHTVEAERAQNEALTKQIVTLTQRIDAQRDDIRALQMLLIRHMDRENGSKR